MEIEKVKIFHISSTGFSVTWETCGDLDNQKFESIEFQVRFYRKQFRLQRWSFTDITTASIIELTDLEPSTLYLINIIYRTKSKDGTISNWNYPESTCDVRTWSIAKEYRFKNYERIVMYMSNKLPMFEEPEHVPDSYLSKASRGFDGLITFASGMGYGGINLRMVKKVWELRQVGLATLIFREDLVDVVFALGTQLRHIGQCLDLSSTELIIGSYYYLWESKKTRLYHPESEHKQHCSNNKDIIKCAIGKSLIRALRYYLSFATMVYRSHPAQVQWVLKEDYQLICYKGKSEKEKPAFGVFASKVKKEVIIAIRGTHSVDDLFTNHSFATTEMKLSLFKDSTTSFMVSRGMLRAAKWLVSGNLDIGRTDSSCEEEEEDGAGIKHMVKYFSEQGYTIKILGHSLGGAVSILSALLLASIFNEMYLDVFAYGTPPCVDYKLMSASIGLYKNETYNIFDRVNIMNFVNRDDLVSRLSMQCLEKCGMEIKSTQMLWKGYVGEDITNFTTRAKSFWEPSQRSRVVLKELFPKQDDVTETRFVLVSEEDEDVKLSVSSTESQLYIPGAILHSYEHNGITKCRMVTGEFVAFSKIAVFANMLDDHRTSNILECLDSLLFLFDVTTHPSRWEEVSANNFSCAVCKYFVGWNSSVGGTSGAVGIRSSHHCYSCGKIVCKYCSENKKTIPRLGIVHPVRVCDYCLYHSTS